VGIFSSWDLESGTYPGEVLTLKMIEVASLLTLSQVEVIMQIKHYTVEAKSYEPNGYNLYNMAGNVSEWTDSSYDPNAYEYVSTMNPNVLDASNKRK
jgi:hypothetical protein